jgi:hypothetical protein
VGAIANSIRKTPAIPDDDGFHVTPPSTDLRIAVALTEAYCVLKFSGLAMIY